MTTTHVTAWEYQARKIQEKKDAEEAANPGPVLRESELIEDGHEIPVEDVSSRTYVGIIARFAVECGWLVKAGESKYRAADRMWKGAVKEGEVKTHQWAQGISEDRKHHFLIAAKTRYFDGLVVDDLQDLKEEIFTHGNAIPAEH